MTFVLTAAARALLDGPNFAVLSTIGRDGSPHSSVVWVEREEDHLLFATVRGRQKERDIRRDPRVSMTVFDVARPYHYVEVRGLATVVLIDAVVLNDRLARKYTGEDFKYHRPGQVRVAVRIDPIHATGSAVRQVPSERADSATR
ncbi:PPOX class F420-dependent oxidoreductase [Umezawaea sp. Da 62-37]|uniref:PPOX class F420-dependent oxidoreductase n=1 Tax=Umezawaea sp. Da 62-37 TaxID=3075927 RepID=UPI0028F72C07|nr:PPOX class F420-dependent oxidoreductase [Umezawaea sp. Da 62-37]WNV84986.1 PPOX class F420-dependent oxidoreductase [Umezawaea sp. Da 62-37]